MPEVFKAIVRRRDDSDDEGVPPEEVWPPEFSWVADWDRYDFQTGRFISGCVTPFETHDEALAEAIQEADIAREKNAREMSECIHPGPIVFAADFWECGSCGYREVSPHV